MTQQRDLKRRIRERQTKTGESYVTARAQVLAARSVISVVEPLDISDTAAPLGFRSRVLLFPGVTLSPRHVLERVRDALLVCDSEPLRTLALHGISRPMPRRWHVDRTGARAFLERVQAGIGGVSPSGMNLALHVDGLAVIATGWHHSMATPPTLVLATVGELSWSGL